MTTGKEKVISKDDDSIYYKWLLLLLGVSCGTKIESSVARLLGN
jgi:hypothetical protein